MPETTRARVGSAEPNTRRAGHLLPAIVRAAGEFSAQRSADFYLNVARAPSKRGHLRGPASYVIVASLLATTMSVTAGTRRNAASGIQTAT